MKSQKIGFFTRLKKSIFNFEDYEIFIQEKTINAFEYFFKIIAILSMLVILALTYINSLTPIIYPIMFLVSFILYSIIILLDVFTLSILGIITNNIIRTNFKYKTILKISIYAMTLPIILYLLYSIATFLGITIKYFQIAYRAIGYIYLITVMLIMKADVIKNTQELQRVLEEQKRVKEELKRQAEEEQEKQRQKEKQEEKKERKEKDKEKPTQEPQPDNG